MFTPRRYFDGELRADLHIIPFIRASFIYYSELHIMPQNKVNCLCSMPQLAKESEH